MNDDERNSIAWLEAFYEKKRATVRNSLIEQVEMLELAEHALKNGALHVTQEFIERVADSLRGNIDNLERGSWQD